MKKAYISIIASTALLMSSCGSTNLLSNLGTTTDGTTTSTSSSTGTNVLSSVLGSLGSQNTVNSLLDLVIGKTTVTQDQLVGTWKYNAPGVAFTSENLLTQAGGAVAAGQVKDKLATSYNKVGIKASNTYFTFGSDNTFQGKVDGVPVSGNYTLDSSKGQLKLSMMLTSLTGYVTRTTNGVAITFESKKLITVLQTLTALSGNSTLQTLGSLSSDIDGVRIGFDMKQ